MTCDKGSQVKLIKLGCHNTLMLSCSPVQDYINVTSFSSISYCSHSEYWPQKSPVHITKTPIPLLKYSFDLVYISQCEIYKPKENFSFTFLAKFFLFQDVLAHPKVRLFVSHGGQSSCQESLCHQKPMVSLKRVFQQEFKIELWFPATAPGTGDRKCSPLLNILLFKVEFVSKYVAFILFYQQCSPNSQRLDKTLAEREEMY